MQLNAHSYHAAAREIGVITPYHAQASKIQQLLAALQPGIAKDEQSRVASVELFQGEVGATNDQ